MSEIGSGIPGQAVLGTASSVFIRECNNRKKVIICNASAVDIWICRGQNAVVNSGIYLKASGGAFIDEPDSLGRIYSGVYSGIVAAGTPTISYSEDR